MDSTVRITEACIGCGICAKICIRGHLAIVDGKACETESRFDCFKCGHCQAACPREAISLTGSEIDSIDCRAVEPEELADLFSRRRSLRWFDRNCTREELESLFSAIRYAPTAENSRAVQYAVIDESFPEFMVLLASILRTHMSDHPRIEQFVNYVDEGMIGKNNPFTWEGRQIIIAFSRISTDAVISMEHLDLMTSCSGLGGFHSRWILKAAEDDPQRFMSFFPNVSPGLNANAAYVIGHPRLRFKRGVHRDPYDVFWC